MLMTRNYFERSSALIDYKLDVLWEQLFNEFLNAVVSKGVVYEIYRMTTHLSAQNAS